MWRPRKDRSWRGRGSLHRTSTQIEDLTWVKLPRIMLTEDDWEKRRWSWSMVSSLCSRPVITRINWCLKSSSTLVSVSARPLSSQQTWVISLSNSTWTCKTCFPLSSRHTLTILSSSSSHYWLKMIRSLSTSSWENSSKPGQSKACQLSAPWWSAWPSARTTSTFSKRVWQLQSKEQRRTSSTVSQLRMSKFLFCFPIALRIIQQIFVDLQTLLDHFRRVSSINWTWI